MAALVTGLAGVLGLGPGGPGGPGDAGIDPGATLPGMDPRLGQSRTLTLTLRQILQGSSFRLSLGRDEEGAAHPRLTAWGRVAATQYDGRNGTLAVDGDVLTGLIGVDGVNGTGCWPAWRFRTAGATAPTPCPGPPRAARGTWSRP